MVGLIENSAGVLESLLGDVLDTAASKPADWN